MESEKQINDRNAYAFDEGLVFHEWPRQSIPRIVNVRATAKGAACPEFKWWLFERMQVPSYPKIDRATFESWATRSFERVT